MFQHTAARRRLPWIIKHFCVHWLFQHTAARRRLPQFQNHDNYKWFVSTHSRPKAAAEIDNKNQRYLASFNTQPPEGGCRMLANHTKQQRKFQHTAARRRLRPHLLFYNCCTSVSTHSRPKAAANQVLNQALKTACFNTQPPEGGCRGREPCSGKKGGFNTQPPEGGCDHSSLRGAHFFVSTHSRPKAAALYVQLEY